MEIRLDGRSAIVTGGSKGLGLAIAKGFGGVRLDEIVDSGGPAADGRFGDFCEFKAGNACEQSAWLLA